VSHECFGGGDGGWVVTIAATAGEKEASIKRNKYTLMPPPREKEEDLV
jgi:hypothetical protein